MSPGRDESAVPRRQAASRGSDHHEANGLGVLQVFIGLGAVGGGLGLVLEPTGANVGIPLEWLENSPFSS